MVRRGVVLTLAIGLLWVLARPADAIPVFAHRYGFTCQACHTTIPHLNPFGEAFLAHGYRIPGLQPKGAAPVAIKTQLGYTSGTTGGDADSTHTGPLPKLVVNEVEALMGGSLGSRTSYWAETYIVDGGFPGRVRDLWVSQRITGDTAPTPISLRVGQQEMDLPVDTETFRETPDPYAIYSLNGYQNPFTFFAPKLGVSAVIGSQAHGTSATVSLLQGHEAGSGLPTDGFDRGLYVQQVRGDFTLSAYRYDGARPVFGQNDEFWRQGYGLTWAHRGTEVVGVYQTGYDARADQWSDGLFSSGGFVQLRQDINARSFAIVRWDATRGNDFRRAWTGGLGYRLRRNMRLTAFDSVVRAPDGVHNMHTLNTDLLFAY